MGGMKMGPGWRYTPYVLEFERPSWMDENSFMRNGSNTVWKDSSKNTRLRSGYLRVVDLGSGATLDFSSSLILGYAVDNIGNAVITVSGLSSNGLPTFTPGIRQSGATLVQLTNTLSYMLNTPDGAQITFDHEGRMQQARDRYGKTQTYNYDSLGNLTNIVDMAGQKLTLTYDPTTSRVMSVWGPFNEQVTYTYNPTGCLATATHVRSGASTTYTYNQNKQLLKKTMFNGLTAVESDPDLKGRANEANDLRSNKVVSTFTQNQDGSVRTTETSDPLVTDPEFEPAQKHFDRKGRILANKGVTGTETIYGYDAGSLLPNVVDLPIAGRPAITIERNAYGQPTQIIDPGNIGAQDVTASYDASTKLLLQSSDQAGRNTEMTYNTNKSVARVRRHLGAENVDVSYSYTTNGALFSVTNALGARVQTIYRDHLDRPTNVVDATGVSIHYQYDGTGRVWRVFDPRMNGPVEYLYDNFDRVVRINYPVGFVTYEYDPAKGWLVRQTDVLGRATSYVRDPKTGDILHVVDEVSGGSNRITSIAYNRFGQVTNVAPPDAQPISFNYDDIGRPLGSSERDAMPPGKPLALDSDQADDGVPTAATNHMFVWGAPHTDSGIAGYSYGLDQVPDTTLDVSNAPAVWMGVSTGSHTFQVRALGRNGLWGEPAVFNLLVSKARQISVTGNLAFGSVLVGQSAQRTLTIQNSGGSAVTVSNIIFPSGFAGAWSGTLTGGRATNIQVIFTPLAGQEYSGTITVQSDAEAGTSTISCSGVGVVPTRILGIGGSLTFGEIFTGETATASMVISNAGNATLAVTNIVYPFGFSGAWTGSVVASGSVSVTVTFAPIMAQAYGGTIAVQSDATAGSSTLSCSGLGMVPTRILGLQADLAFGLVATGRVVSRSLVITNSGNALLSLTNLVVPTGFAVNWTGTVAAGKATNVLVVFAPINEGPYGGPIQFMGNMTGGSDQLVCSGTGGTPARASFYANTVTGRQPFTVTFHDQSAGHITNRLWAFGDGEEAQSPGGTVQHTYFINGTATVSLVVAGGLGTSTSIVPNYVVIERQSSSYLEWAARIQGPMTNPEQVASADGYPNLLKYATGADPDGKEQLSALGYRWDGTNFFLVFNRNTNATDVSIHVESSAAISNSASWIVIATNDLGRWGETSNVTETGVGSPVMVTVRDGVVGETGRYMRLCIGIDTAALNPGLIVIEPVSLALDLGPAGVSNAWASATVTSGIVRLRNAGGAPLNVSTVRIMRASTFGITSVVSTVKGTIALTGTNRIAGGGVEDWIITTTFSPTNLGVVTNTLRVVSNDPSRPTLDIALRAEGWWAGIGYPHILESSGVATNLQITFTNTVADGTGGAKSSETIWIDNFGMLPLGFENNYIYSASSNFVVGAITSSVSGAITFQFPEQLDPCARELWTIPVIFDPRSVGSFTSTVYIMYSTGAGYGFSSVKVVGTGISP